MSMFCQNNALSAVVFFSWYIELLECYGHLSQTASDEALRDFLEIIQKNHKQVLYIIIIDLPISIFAMVINSWVQPN